MKSRRRQGWLVAGVGLPLLVIGAVYARAEGEGGAKPDKPDKPQSSMIERFDTNGDGVLTQDEVTEKVWQKIAGADADGNGQVTAEELKAHAPKSEGDKPSPEAMFKRFDTDGDGAVTEAEVPAEVWAKVSRADADGNGQVSAGEFATLHKPEGGDKGPKPEGDRPGPEGMFKRFDTDGNGALTQTEVPADIWGKVAGADADGNGQVTLDEFKAAHPGDVGKPGPEGLFKNHDANGDGALTADEVPAELWEKLKAHDANGDGSITKDEMPKPAWGPEAMLKQHDANGDGALTADEVPAELWAKLVKGDADGDGQITAAELPQPRRDGDKAPKEGKPAKPDAE